MIFFKYRDKIYPFKLEITEPYIAKFSDATDKQNSYKFLFGILFSSPTDTKRFTFVKNKVFLSSRYPFSISSKELTYQVKSTFIFWMNKNKSLIKNVPETGAIDVDSNLLSFFRNQLQDLFLQRSKNIWFSSEKRFSFN